MGILCGTILVVAAGVAAAGEGLDLQREIAVNAVLLLRVIQNRITVCHMLSFLSGCPVDSGAPLTGGGR